jgi:hypothetical protein
LLECCAGVWRDGIAAVGVDGALRGWRGCDGALCLEVADAVSELGEIRFRWECVGGAFVIGYVTVLQIGNLLWGSSLVGHMPAADLQQEREGMVSAAWQMFR